MFVQPIDVILFVAGVSPLVFAVLVQCASGKRSRKRNSPKTKTKVTQSSVSSTQSVKKTSKLQKNKAAGDVEESPRRLSRRERQTKGRGVASKQDDSIWSSKSESRLASSRSETRSQKKRRDSVGGIPMVAAGTPKDMQGKSAPDAPTTNDVIFKEPEQSTQEAIGLAEEKEEQDLILEPKNLRWSGEGGYQTVHLQNATNDRLAVKAKCSDNHVYRVNPVFGFIEPEDHLKFDIIRQPAVPKVDKMIFVTVRATKEDLFPKPLFKRSQHSQTKSMLPLLVAPPPI